MEEKQEWVNKHTVQFQELFECFTRGKLPLYQSLNSGAVRSILLPKDTSQGPPLYNSLRGINKENLFKQYRSLWCQFGGLFCRLYWALDECFSFDGGVNF